MLGFSGCESDFQNVLFRIAKIETASKMRAAGNTNLRELLDMLNEGNRPSAQRATETAQQLREENNLLKQQKEAALLEKRQFEERLKNVLYQNSLYKNIDKIRKEAEKFHHICVECERKEDEQSMHLCSTCHELKFDDLKDLKANVICAACAIKKHIRQVHQVVDFYPYLRAHNFSAHSVNFEKNWKEFNDANMATTVTMSSFNFYTTQVTKMYGTLTDMTRRSKNTQNQIELANQVNVLLERSKSIQSQIDAHLKESVKVLEENLSGMEKWCEEQEKHCVDNNETIDLQNEDQEENKDITVKKRKVDN